MTPKQAIEYTRGLLKNGGNQQKQDYVNTVIETLERQMPKCYGIVFDQNKEPFIFEFKHNDVTSVEFVNGVWVAHRHYREDIKE